MFDFGFLMFDEGADVGCGPTSLQTLLRSGGASKGWRPSALRASLRSGGASSFAKASEDMSKGCSLVRSSSLDIAGGGVGSAAKCTTR